MSQKEKLKYSTLYHKLSQRQLDTIHLPLWILKDACWMMEFKTAGIAMILPTVSVALILCVKSYKHLNRFLLNSAVFCWIVSNAMWMLSDFFEWPLQIPCLILFSIGLITVSAYYIRRYQDKNRLNPDSQE